MNIKSMISYAGDGVGVVLTAMQTEHSFKVASLILTIIATSISIAFTIWNWYKSAKKDGKITLEEINELGEKIEEQLHKKERK